MIAKFEYYVNKTYGKIGIDIPKYEIIDNFDYSCEWIFSSNDNYNKKILELENDLNYNNKILVVLICNVKYFSCSFNLYKAPKNVLRQLKLEKIFDK